MELRRYAQNAVVPQPFILHGPRGVGKRTLVEGLLEEWSRDPHSTAYVDLYAQFGGGSEGKCIPPWTLIPSSTTAGPTSQGGSDLHWVRRKLEQGLESLAIRAVQVGCLKNKNVFDALTDRHTVDGALYEFLSDRTLGTGSSALSSSGELKHLWQHALVYMRRALGVDSHPIQGGEITCINEVLHAVLENSVADSLDITATLSNGNNRKKGKNSANVQIDAKEKALLSLALAKHLLQIQENWRLAAGADRQKKGLLSKGLVDAVVSWPSLLLELVSSATQEGLFQPKLVINGIELLRNASSDMGCTDGSSYHDALLLQLVNNSLTQGSFPVILVSSDSYYSWQLGDDFGSTDAFISSEIFGWTPKEAALHLVPGVYTTDEWKVVVAVLGSNPRHSVELLQLRYSKAFSERMKNDDLDIEDCIDLYLAYLQVTAVDPAMDAALALLEQFASKAMKGDIDGNLLQHGAPWRDFPRNDDKQQRQRWARIQMVDFVQAFTSTEFGVNYLGGDMELLDDPAARALIQVGLLYQQRAPPFVRPTSRGILRCLTRWFVKEKLYLESSDNLRFKWHRLVRGRSYRHLMRE
nr:uncharacterized protein LOC112275554 isoform X2 [Physcomitrium patens]|eukprot:XP_024361784.1 uncharacterized protein LOC112275554 isoform X2 [Physcomitrella patens]